MNITISSRDHSSGSCNFKSKIMCTEVGSTSSCLVNLSGSGVKAIKRREIDAKVFDVAYYINEQVFAGRSNKFSGVIEAYCPDWPSENN